MRPTFLARAPLGHMREPGNIAEVLLLLASAAYDYMSGETVVVDG